MNVGFLPRVKNSRNSRSSSSFLPHLASPPCVHSICKVYLAERHP